jgi:hypothetical protein
LQSGRSSARQVSKNGIDRAARRQPEANNHPASELLEPLPTSVPESRKGDAVDIELNRRSRGRVVSINMMNSAWRAPNAVFGDFDAEPTIKRRSMRRGSR